MSGKRFNAKGKSRKRVMERKRKLLNPIQRGSLPPYVLKLDLPTDLPGARREARVGEGVAFSA